MSFSNHTVVTAADVAKGTGISVSLQKVRGAQASMVLSIKTAVAERFAWLHNDLIEVALGEDEHHGLVRLKKTEAGTARLVRREAGNGDGKRGGPYFRLDLGRVPLFIDRSESKRWVIFDAVEDGWIEIVLPGWADETGPKGSRSDRPRMSAGVAALPPPTRQAGTALTAQMMGDPPASRSALAQRKSAGGGVGELTRGQARRHAERAEAEDYSAVEAGEWNRKAREDDRLADFTTAFGLTKTEARYLRELMNGRLGTKEGLLRAGHDESEDVEIKIVDVIVHKLRKKLATRLVEIETVWGQGYRMNAENVARVMVLMGTGNAPSREDDEAELAALGDNDEAAA